MNVDLLPIINAENEKVSFGGKMTFDWEDAVIEAQVDGYVQNFAGSLEVHGKVDASVNAQCAKCLEPVCEKYSLTLNETVGEDGVEPDGTMLNIDDIVYAELAVNMPIRFVCGDDCKGLCPKCGANLNIAQCQCTDEDEIDERFLKPRFERRKR